MITIALAALYIMPCVIFLFFVKNDMLEKPDKSKSSFLCYGTFVKRTLAFINLIIANNIWYIQNVFVIL